MSPPVRPARPSDADRVRTVQQHLSEPSPALLEAALDALATGPGSLTPSLYKTWKLVVTPDRTDNPVGYLLAIDRTAIHIVELVVAPTHRRQQRATALLESVAASGRPVTVCVAADNEAARLVYKQSGFTEVGRQTDQFDSGDGLTLRYEPAN